MNSHHFSAEDFDAYLRGDLPAPELLAASDHLAGCETCRGTLGQLPPQFSVATDESISYEEISAWLDDALDPLARKEVAAKFQASYLARAELSDLARFREEMNAAAAVQKDPRSFSRWILPLAAGVMIAAGAWLFIQRETLPTSINTALASGQLEIPAKISALAGKRETLAGAANFSAEPKLLAPVATAVANPLLSFKWTAVRGATGYRVQVASKKSGEVISSEIVSTTEWTPPRAVSAGENYEWQLEVFRGDEVIARAPAPPNPEAKFLVLSDTDRAAFERTKKACASSPLARGVAEAQFGLLDDAAADFRQLSADARAQKFLQQINDLRRPR